MFLEPAAPEEVTLMPEAHPGAQASHGQVPAACPTRSSRARPLAAPEGSPGPSALEAPPPVHSVQPRPPGTPGSPALELLRDRVATFISTP